jgi:hypothetical protein
VTYVRVHKHVQKSVKYQLRFDSGEGDDDRFCALSSGTTGYERYEKPMM